MTNIDVPLLPLSTASINGTPHTVELLRYYATAWVRGQSAGIGLVIRGYFLTKHLGPCLYCIGFQYGDSVVAMLSSLIVWTHPVRNMSGPCTELQARGRQLYGLKRFHLEFLVIGQTTR